MPSYAERCLDYELVTSKEAIKIIDELGFTLVGWKDLRSATPYVKACLKAFFPTRS